MNRARIAAGLAFTWVVGCAGEQRPVAQVQSAAAATASAEPCPEVGLRPAATGSSAAPPSLPAVRLEKEPIQFDEDSLTVWGASYYLRSRHHRADVTREAISITGYITKTSLPDAPACAVHKAGKADPENCRAEIPTFWLGDSPDAPESDCIRVMGFASNYAQLYDAIQLFDRGKRGERYMDTFWGVMIPNPLPARGAKVTVRGRFGTTFTKASTGIVTDSTMGILTFEEMLTLQPARELATLPGLKRKGELP
jgi:hypothetical protein